MSKLIFDNKLNIIIDLEIDAVEQGGKIFKVGDTVECNITKSTFKIIHFELKILKCDDTLISPIIMAIGEEEGSSLNDINVL